MDETVDTPAKRTDRRKKPTNPFSIASLFGRRRRFRRSGDRERHIYVDRYGLGAGTVFLVVVLLSTVDAFLTLRLVSSGGREINPIMDFFLQLGPLPFLLSKYLITGVSLFFLLIHKEYYWYGLRVKYLLFALLLGYGVLLMWELYLLRSI